MTSWHEHKERMSRPDFIARFPHPFLWIGADPDATVPEFNTVVGDATGPQVALGVEASLIPLVKGKDNPYADRIMLGRAQNCDVVIRHSSVSKLHADFQIRSPVLALLTDRRSRNGIRVNGQDLLAGASVEVRPGDKIAFGGFGTTFLGPGDVYDRL